MLRLALKLPARSQNLFQYAAYNSSAPTNNSLRPPLDLDPSLQALLNEYEYDIPDISKLSAPRQRSGERKSPAAVFGSQQIGMLILPSELQSAITQLIKDGKKSQIRSDAQRLFQSDTNDKEEPEWDTKYEQNYGSKLQAFRHAARDGTAFASVALPAHYSAIFSVLLQVKSRLAPDWQTKRIIDWGSGTGSGLWATIHSFQKASTNPEGDTTAQNSTITSYLGIDKREGLVSIGKKLVSNTTISDINIRWQKYFKKEDTVQREDCRDTIALSAFFLTSLPDHFARKNLVKEIWNSGAHTIILIDHNTKEGFEAIAHARQYMLEVGKKELEDPDIKWPIRGSHVLAPCPHDQECPLLNTKRAPLICGFTQRLQRPPFVRVTKRSVAAHEDMEFSYVVIQRGSRPDPVDTSVGRMGEFGKKRSGSVEVHVEGTGSAPPSQTEDANPDHGLPPSELQAQLRLEAYQWPRLIFPPLKKGGHAILDACTYQGKIMRLTITKSQGKQAFYDARKSRWGDIFPHPPKNRALVRFVPDNTNRPFIGQDIGKRGDTHKKRDKLSYEAIADAIRENRKKSKREYARIRGSKVWEIDEDD